CHPGRPPFSQFSVGQGLTADGKPLSALSADNSSHRGDIRRRARSSAQTSCNAPALSPTRLPALAWTAVTAASSIAAAPAVSESAAPNLRPGFVHGERSSIRLLAIQRRHRLFGFFVIRHGDKAEPA